MLRAASAHPQAQSLRLKGDDGAPAVLLLHGYIGSTTDLGELPQKLNASGFTVEAPLLPGHGTDPRELGGVTAQHLIRFALERYDALSAEHERVYVVGFSTGGAMAAILAAQRPASGLVLLAPYFKISHQWYYLLPAEWHCRIFAPLIPYVYRGGLFRQINNRAALQECIDYKFISLHGAGEALKLGRLAQQQLAAVEAPMCVIHSRHDKATDYSVVRRLIRPPRRLVTVERSNHILLRDYDKARVENEVLDFLQQTASVR